MTPQLLCCYYYIILFLKPRLYWLHVPPLTKIRSDQWDRVEFIWVDIRNKQDASEISLGLLKLCPKTNWCFLYKKTPVLGCMFGNVWLSHTVIFQVRKVMKILCKRKRLLIRDIFRLERVWQGPECVSAGRSGHPQLLRKVSTFEKSLASQRCSNVLALMLTSYCYQPS